MVSDSEKVYIISGCDQSFRSDGRGCFDYREINIENNILPHVGKSTHFTHSLHTQLLTYSFLHSLTRDYFHRWFVSRAYTISH